MPVKKHVHFYGRRPIYNAYTVWACFLPDCSHYQPIGTRDEMLEGKFSICWSCTKEFRLTRAQLEHDRPCCSEKCQMEYDKVNQLTQMQITPEPNSNPSNTMCENCHLRLKHGDLKWCWECTMR